MARTSIYYAFFLVLSAAIHWLAVSPPWPLRAPEPKQVEKPVAIEIKKIADEAKQIEQALAQEIAKAETPAPAPAPPAAPAPLPVPVPVPVPGPEKPEPPKVTYAENLPPAPDPELERLREEKAALERRLVEEKEAADRKLALEREAAQRNLAAEKEAAERERLAAEADRRRAEDEARKQAQALAAAAQREAAAKARAADEARLRAEADAAATRETARLEIERERAHKAELARRLEEERVLKARAEAARADAERTAAAQARDAARREEESRARAARERAAAEAAVQAREAERARADAAARETAARDAELKRKLERLDDWTRFTSAQARGPIDGTKVPQLQFAGDKSEREFLELMEFYGMELIVYPAASRRFLATVELATGEVRSVQDPRGFLARFSNRCIEQRGAYWRGVAESVARRFGARADELVVQAVIPERTAAYLAWKETEVCRKAGLDPATVATCFGSYQRTSQGTWIVRIAELATFEGKRLSVRDFE